MSDEYAGGNAKQESGMRSRASRALKQSFGRGTHAQGNVAWPQENPINEVRLAQFERDLQEGDGNGLRMKFCALHSSAALAVNCFARFKDRPEGLSLLGEKGALSVRFEKRMPIIPDRRPSNLDVWIDRGQSAVGIESKLLEYFEPKKPVFSDAYEVMQPDSEECWWHVYTEARNGAAKHLDVAQLVKHYWGSRRHQIEAAEPLDLTLLYLFWEPTNSTAIPECQRHRDDLGDLTEKVAGSAVRFRSMTYPDPWGEWSRIPALEEHARNLIARYNAQI